MKRIFVIAFATVISLVSSSLANGQDYFDGLLAEIAQRNAMHERSMAQTNQAIVNE